MYACVCARKVNAYNLLLEIKYACMCIFTYTNIFRLKP